MKHFFYADFVSVITSVIDSAIDKYDKKIDPAFKTYVARFYAEALSGMLIDWAKEKDKRNREEVIAYKTDMHRRIFCGFV